MVIFHSSVNVYQAGYPQPTHNHPAHPGCTLLTLEVLFNAPAIAMAMSPALLFGRGWNGEMMSKFSGYNSGNRW